MKLFFKLCLVLLAFGCQSTQKPAKKSPAGNPSPGWMIAYNLLVDSEKSDYEIFIMNPDGSNPRNISNHPGVDWVYYAYDDKLYFVSDRDTCSRCYFLYEMDSEGKNVRKIFDRRLADSWVSSRGNGSEFVVKTRTPPAFLLIDRRGNVLDTMLEKVEFSFGDATFSPDGRQLVFRSRESGTDELWMLDVDKGARRQLTHYPPADSTRNPHQYHAGPPLWAPNQNLISFISDRGGSYSIFTIHPDGSGERQLTPDGFDQGWHAWSPDGRWIVYDGTPSDHYDYNIYLMRADGSDLRQLTHDPLTEQAPVFVRRK